MYKGIISFLAFTYVVASFGLSGVSGISRIGLYSAVILFLVIITSINKLKIPNWIILICFFYTYLAVPAIARENTSFDILGTMIVAWIGAISIGLLLYNKMLSYKVIVYGALMAAAINICAISLGLDAAAIIEKGRSSGLTGNPNSLSMYLGIVAFMVWLLPERFSWPIRLFAVFIAIYGMYVSGSRKGLLLATALLFLVLANFLIKLSKPKLIMFISVIVASLAISYTLIPEITNKHKTDIVAIDRIYDDLSGQNKSISGRIFLINTGYKLWKESPLFGLGFSQFSNLSGFGAYAHNNYIELAVSGGIIGMILFYSIHFIILRNALKQPIAFRLRLMIFVFTILLTDIAAVTFYDKASLCTLLCLLTLSSDTVVEPV